MTKNNPPPTDRCDECKEVRDKEDYCSCTRPDWTSQCMYCGSSPILPITNLCGPCTFGEAETLGGNW
jgi:hypothetical protein